MSIATRLALMSLTAGAFWGGVAWLLGGKALGSSIAGGVIASPLIGWLVARATHGRFVDASAAGRVFWSLASLYFGAIVFGVACGLGALAVGRGRSAPEVVFEPVVAVLWGVTITGFVLVLVPLTYATHWWLEQRLMR